jgi:hypothetical protein
MIRVVARVADSSTPIGMIVGIGIAGVFLTFWSTLNYDVGWFLVGSRRVLEGADLYADGFVDMNPPLILYFFVPAAAIAGWTGFSEITLLRLQTLVVTAMCLWLAWAMITRLFGADDRLRGLYLLSALAFAGFVSPILNLGNEGVAFSQREHLVTLFLLPYALLAAARIRARRVPAGLALVVGCLAGLAVSLKPQYIVALLALEVLILAYRGPRFLLLRPDPWAAGAVGFAYLTFVALVTPAYFESAMPLGMRTYWAYQVPLSQLIGWLPLVLLGFGGIAVRLTPEAGATRTTAFVFLTLAAACYAAYLLGGTNFSYHLLPFHASILVCLVAPLVARLPADAKVAGSRAGRFSWGGAVAILGILAIAVSPTQAGRSLRSLGTNPVTLSRLVQSVIEREGAGAPVLVLSTTTAGGFPAANYAGADWTLRLGCLWPLPAVMRARAGRPGDEGRLSDAEIDEVETYLRRVVVEDLHARTPNLVFIDRRTRKQALAGLPLDILAFLRVDPDFAAEWQRYKFIGRVGHFEVHRRTPRSS